MYIQVCTIVSLYNSQRLHVNSLIYVKTLPKERKPYFDVTIQPSHGAFQISSRLYHISFYHALDGVHPSYLDTSFSGLDYVCLEDKHNTHALFWKSQILVTFCCLNRENRTFNLPINLLVKFCTSYYKICVHTYSKTVQPYADVLF